MAACKKMVEPSIFLVGNKQDLCHMREVGWDEGQKLAIDNKCQFCELSAAEHYQEVVAMFTKVLRNITSNFKVKEKRRPSGSKSMAKLINNMTKSRIPSKDVSTKEMIGGTTSREGVMQSLGAHSGVQAPKQTHTQRSSLEPPDLPDITSYSQQVEDYTIEKMHSYSSKTEVFGLKEKAEANLKANFFRETKGNATTISSTGGTQPPTTSTKKMSKRQGAEAHRSCEVTGDELNTFHTLSVKKEKRKTSTTTGNLNPNKCRQSVKADCRFPATGRLTNDIRTTANLAEEEYG
ncbi:hypothetical protein IHE44_0011842, partial [Lamprotornis superbus]